MAKILIVEDKQDVRISLRAMLEAEGHDIIEAGNGREGLEIVQNTPDPIDSIITDIMMPDIDGFEFIDTLKGMGFSIPTLVISGGGYQMGIGKLLKSAAQIADHVLEKPFTPDELYTALKIANENKVKKGL